MSVPVDKKNDFIDLFLRFFIENPRDLFRALNNFFYGNNHLIGKETRAIGKGLKNFSRAADIFAFADFLTHLNTLRNHFNKKEVVKDMPSLVFDTSNSVAEATSWLSTTGILSLSAYASSWVTSVSGITLMISFSKRAILDIQDLRKPTKDEPEALKQRKITMFNLAKNIAFFALGAFLFANGWFGFALNIAGLTISSTVAIISSFASYYLEKRNEEENKAQKEKVLDPSRVSAPATS